MIRHIVLFKFNDGISWNDPRATEAEKALVGLASKMPEVQSWFVGRNFSERPIAYDYALIVGLSDREALQSYLVNADHQAAVKLWAEISHWNLADVEY